MLSCLIKTIWPPLNCFNLRPYSLSKTLKHEGRDWNSYSKINVNGNSYFDEANCFLRFKLRWFNQINHVRCFSFVCFRVMWRLSSVANSSRAISWSATSTSGLIFLFLYNVNFDWICPLNVWPLRFSWRSRRNLHLFSKHHLTTAAAK